MNLKEEIKKAMNYSLLFESKVAGVSIDPDRRKKIEFYLAACEMPDSKFRSIVENKDVLNYCSQPHKFKVFSALLEFKNEKKERVKRSKVEPV